ncbi:PIN domain-containing protein [Algoriphagus sp.]|jgi:predicted nucleic-acid-binding protein|uniref:PIN domain-containing protein n=1 Tax=Algoriphagus sp. TaxID=1872435 RepID=UPI002721778E|nr:PIN domain-containing protein [Algoriphagus sp.]MDO8965710.1 PIN domain-containing protein [Algoriphagus sp.]MDP3202403.1 PIN domain-containing protein [Algoriphagus sp.]
MAFIDANYILRYLLQDNPKQFLIVKEVIENQEISLTDFIFAEVVYVLEKVYSVPKSDIKESLGGLIKYKYLFMENKNVILKSLQIYSENKIDFADALLIAYHQESSNTILHTFDKKILKIISLE